METTVRQHKESLDKLEEHNGKMMKVLNTMEREFQVYKTVSGWVKPILTALVGGGLVYVLARAFGV